MVRSFLDLVMAEVAGLECSPPTPSLARPLFVLWHAQLWTANNANLMVVQIAALMGPGVGPLRAVVAANWL